MPATTAELDLASFWDAVHGRYRGALGSGALQPIDTRASYVAERGVEFVVRVSDNLLRKRQAPAGSHPDNPFLHPEPELTIGALPPHHLAVLNKFNVLEHHVLVVTRGFVHQEAPLASADFTALAAGLASGRALAFYNAGRVAGASQAHRHFQLVPLPLGREVDIPASALVEDAAEGTDTVRGFRFRHALRFLDVDPGNADRFGRACFQAYRDALDALGLEAWSTANGDSRLPPYNLLLTPRWLLMVPRSREHHHAAISVNGLGYAGSLFVSSDEKRDHIQATGPMHLLEAVSFPRC